MAYLFSSESVSEGHPDKVADQISDALLDQFLAYDEHAHHKPRIDLAKRHLSDRQPYLDVPQIPIPMKINMPYIYLIYYYIVNYPLLF